MPETLADLLRQVGVQPSAREQFVESTRRPGYVVPRPRPRTMRSPEDRARDPNAGVRNQAREQSQAAYNTAQRGGALQGRLARSEAYDPGIDPNTGLTQGQEAILGAAEFTGAPSAFRSYDAFANGRPWEGVGHAGLGALAVLGNAGVGASPRVSPRPQLPMRGALSDAPTRLPVNPSRNIAANGLPIRPSEPFRNSLRGGSDDLAEAAALRPRGLDAGGLGAGRLPPSIRHEAGTGGDFYHFPSRPGGAEDVTVSVSRSGTVDIAYRGRTRGRGTADEALRVFRNAFRVVEADALGTGRARYKFKADTPRLASFYERMVRERPLPGYAFESNGDGFFVLSRNRSPSSGAEQTGRAATSVPAGARGSAREVLDVPLSNGRTTEVIRNPSQADLMRLSVLPRELGPETRRTAAGQLRYIQDANGDVYVFRGWDAIHDDVAGGMDRMGRRLGGYQRDDGGRTDHGRFGYLRRDGDTFVSGNGEPLSPRVQEMLAPRRVPRKPPQSKRNTPRPKPGFFMPRR